MIPFATALNDPLAMVRTRVSRERQFVANVAHQLRTPLAGLQLGLARAAEAEDLDNARRVLGELGQATLRTARLVMQLLVLSGLEPGAQATAELVPFDLSALAREVGTTLLDMAASKSIRMELVMPEQPVVTRLHPE